MKETNAIENEPKGIDYARKKLKEERLRVAIEQAQRSNESLDFSVKLHFEALSNALHQAKPNDRSEKDRAYAVLTTMIEKAVAYFIVYILEKR